MPAQPNPLGPTLMTPELVENFCRLVAMGNYYKAACNAVGISYETFNRWMKYGAADSSGPYRVFYDRVRLADAEAEVTAVAAWRQQIPNNYLAARDFLARRYPSRWGNRIKIDVEVQEQLRAVFQRLEEALPPPVYAQVLAVLSSDEALPGENQDSFNTSDLYDDAEIEL